MGLFLQKLGGGGGGGGGGHGGHLEGRVLALDVPLLLAGHWQLEAVVAGEAAQWRQLALGPGQRGVLALV